MSALPAALDLPLEHLTLSSPKSNTVKATAQDDPADVNGQLTSPTTRSTGENTVAGGQDVSAFPPCDEPSQQSDPLLLLLVDDNVSTVILDV